MIPSHSFGESRFAHMGNGRKLHYMVKGSGNPTVVFESGMGLSRSTWGLVQPIVGEHVRAVVYDRAGYGKSDPAAAPRTLRCLADDLNGLLTELGSGPFILVGHSWGGPIVRTAAAVWPERIRGLVLVDPSDERCDLYFAALSRNYYALVRRLIPFMARTGLYRRLSSGYGQVQPADVAADHTREDFSLAAARAMAAESEAFVDEMEQLRRQAPELGHMEVSIISGTLLSRGEKKIRPVIVAAHRQTVAALANARWVASPQSGHMIIYSDPAVIIREIQSMLDGAAVRV